MRPLVNSLWPFVIVFDLKKITCSILRKPNILICMPNVDLLNRSECVTVWRIGLFKMAATTMLNSTVSRNERQAWFRITSFIYQARNPKNDPMNTKKITSSQRCWLSATTFDNQSQMARTPLNNITFCKDLRNLAIFHTVLLLFPIHTVQRLHTSSDQRRDIHAVNAHSNRNVFNWRLNALWSVKSWSSPGNALPNIDGAVCLTPQSLADGHY